MDSLDKEVKEKIIGKLVGMAFMRLLGGEKCRVSNSEFRFIIGEYRISKKDWFHVLKILEKDGVVKYVKFRYIQVLLSPKLLERVGYDGKPY